MTLKRLIASKAMELVQLLEYHEDVDFNDKIVAAVTDCDYAALDKMQNCKWCKNGKTTVPFVFANDNTHEVYCAESCPVCGRCLV